MGLELEYIEGQTPLDEDEKEGLKIRSIATRGELDEFEQLNIEKAIQWTLGKKWDANYILSEEFVQLLHRKMFHDIWTWAGQFRKSNKNIGVDKYQIAVSLKQLLDDTKYWLEKNPMTEEEIAIQFKHRIVKIHCFPNGNGRHSRLIADVIISKIFYKDVFTWNRTDLSKKGETRTKYLNAIRSADGGDIKPLMEFSRS